MMNIHFHKEDKSIKPQQDTEKKGRGGTTPPPIQKPHVTNPAPAKPKS